MATFEITFNSVDELKQALKRMKARVEAQEQCGDEKTPVKEVED